MNMKKGHTLISLSMDKAIKVAEVAAYGLVVKALVYGVRDHITLSYYI